MYPEDKRPPKALSRKLIDHHQLRAQRTGDIPIILTISSFQYGHFLPMCPDGENASHQEFPQTTEKTLAPPGAGIERLRPECTGQ